MSVHPAMRWTMEGGFQVQRGLLCCCDAARPSDASSASGPGSASLLTITSPSTYSTTATGLYSGRTTEPSTPNTPASCPSMARSLASVPATPMMAPAALAAFSAPPSAAATPAPPFARTLLASAPSGRLELFNEDSSAQLQRHAPGCTKVLVKYSVHADGGQARGNVLKLKYEACLHNTLAMAATAAAGAAAGASRSSKLPLLPAQSHFGPRDSSSSSTSSNHSNANSVLSPPLASTTNPAQQELQPHLRTQSAHPRVALVLPDFGGESLLALMQSFHTAQSSSSLSNGGAGTAASTTVPPVLAPGVRQVQLHSHLASPGTAVMRLRQFDANASPAAASSAARLAIPAVCAALRATLAVARELQRLHACALVHCALDPATILFHAPSARVSFLDLSSCALLVKERPLNSASTSSSSASDASSSSSAATALAAAAAAAAAASTAGGSSGSIADGGIMSHMTLGGGGVTSTAHAWLYRSPEQSGKANRAVDARSDLYSLGCVLFELLTGRPPFVSNDALELVHQHLARAPPSILPRVAPLSAPPLLLPLLRATQAILGRLLQKQADERYQSTHGLIHDLRVVLNLVPPTLATASSVSSIDEHGSPDDASSSLLARDEALHAAMAALTSFHAGTLDAASTFRLSGRLYGRDEVIRALRDAYARVGAASSSSSSSSSSGAGDAANETGQVASSSKPQLFLLSGATGTGKSSVVDDLHAYVSSQRGLFARGKFEPQRRDYSAVLQALRALVLQLLVRDAALWRIRILRAVGLTNAGVLVDALPELGRLLGPQAPPPIVGPAEGAARFVAVLCTFVSSLASSAAPSGNSSGGDGGPLVLFVDDMQHADSGALALLRNLMTSATGALLIVGAYRDTEVMDASSSSASSLTTSPSIPPRSLASDAPSSSAHPLLSFLVEQRRLHPRRVTEVMLPPLKHRHIVSLLVDAFRLPSLPVSTAVAASASSAAEKVAPLATLLLARTQGNPFFVTQLLRSYHDAGLITFDFGSSEDEGVATTSTVEGDSSSDAVAPEAPEPRAPGWRWNVDAMQRVPVPDDAVALVCARMQSLSADAQMVLQYAALCGNKISLQALYFVTQLPVGRLARAALELEQAGMLLCASMEHGRDLLLLAQVGPSAVSPQHVTPPAAVDAASTSSSAASTPAGKDDAFGPSSNDALEQASTEAAGNAATSTSAVTADGSASRNEDGAAVENPSFLSRLSSLHLSFAHDQLRQAALQLVAPGHIPSMRCVLASRLLSGYDDAEREEYALDIVTHINLAGIPALCGSSASTEDAAALDSPEAQQNWRDFFSAPGRLSSVVALELVAARQAKSAASYVAASALLHAALQLLQHEASSSSAASAAATTDSDGFLRVDDACWSRSYSFCLSIYTELCTCAYLRSRYAETVSLAEYALEHVTVGLDRAPFFLLHLQSLSAQNLLQQAETSGLAHLEELGVTLLDAMPPEVEAWLTAGIDVADEATFGRAPVLAAEPISDPLHLAQMHMLTCLLPTMYFIGSKRYAGLIYTMLSLTRSAGSSPDAGIAIAVYGVLKWSTNELDVVFAVGSIGQLLVQRFGDAARFAAAGTSCVFFSAVYPWCRPLRSAFTLMLQAIDDALRVGDLNWLQWMLMQQVWLPFLKGDEALPMVLSRNHAKRALCESKGFHLSSQLFSLWGTALEEMVSGVEQVISEPSVVGVNGGGFYASMAQSMLQSPGSAAAGSGSRSSGGAIQTPLVSFNAHLLDGMKAYHLRRLREADQAFEQAETVKSSATALVIMATATFYSCLSLLANCPRLTMPDQVVTSDTSSGPSGRSAVDSLLDPSDDAWRPSVLPASYSASEVESRLRKADELIGVMSVWARSNAHDNLHKLALMLAERHRAAAFSHVALQQPHASDATRTKERCSIFAALALYDRASSSASGSQMFLEAALALELRARCLQAMQNETGSFGVMGAARAVYARLGFQLKLRQLDEEFPQLASLAQPADALASPVQRTATLTNSAAVAAATAAAAMSGPPPPPSALMRHFSLQAGVAPVRPSSAQQRNTLADSPNLARTLLSPESSTSSSGVLVDASATPLVLPQAAVLAPSSSSASVSSFTDTGAPSANSSSTATPLSAMLRSIPAPRALMNNSGASGHTLSTVAPTPSPAPSAPSWDALSLVRAIGQIATEKDQGKLLRRLMHLVLETASATRGVLVLEDAATKDWSVELGGNVDANDDDEEEEEEEEEEDAPAGAQQGERAERGDELEEEKVDGEGDADDEREEHDIEMSPPVSPLPGEAAPAVHKDGTAAAATDAPIASASATSHLGFLSPKLSIAAIGERKATSPQIGSGGPRHRKLQSHPSSSLASLAHPQQSAFGVSPLSRHRGIGIKTQANNTNIAAATAACQDGPNSVSSCTRSIDSASSGTGSTSSERHVRLGTGDLSGVGSVEAALPISVFNFCVSSAETLCLSDPAGTASFAGGYSSSSASSVASSTPADSTSSLFKSDAYFATHKPRALLCMPVLRAGSVFGVLYLENDYRSDAFTSSHIQLLQLLCSQAALSLDNARLYCALSENNASLEAQVKSRTAELEEKNRQLRSAKEAAEAATKIKADFLSNMSHEIRTPMNAVIGIGRLLADTQLSLEQQQYVQMINNSGHLLLTIINDILDYSKLESGMLTLNFSPQNIGDVVEAAVMLCYDMAVSKGLSLAWFVHPGLPPSLMIDSTRLQQILLNLLSNAIKFTKAGSVELELTGRLLPQQDSFQALSTATGSPIVGGRRGSSPNSNSVRSPTPRRVELHCRVKDTGIGISPTQLARLFHSFTQVSGSNEFGPGTGLGLVISQRLVEAMGGTCIAVQSELGHGSTFSFKILADVCAEAPGTNAAMAASHTAHSQRSPVTMGRSSSTGSTSSSGSEASPIASLPAPALHGPGPVHLHTAEQPISSPAPGVSNTRSLSAADGTNNSGSRNTSPSQLLLSAAALSLHQNLHGITVTENGLLARSRWMVVSSRNPGLHAWLRVCAFYGTSFEVCSSVAEARMLLQAHLLHKRVSSGPTSSPAPVGHRSTFSGGDGAGSSPCALLILDLDCDGVSDEAVQSQLCSLMPSRILYLYSSSKDHQLQALLQSNDAGSRTPPTPTPGGTVAQFPLAATTAAAVAASSNGSGPLYPSVRRAVRRPFKSRALLHSLLSLLVEPMPSSGTALASTPTLKSVANSPAGTPVSPPELTIGAGGAAAAVAAAAASAALPSNASTVAANSNARPPRIRSISGQYPLRLLLAEDNVVNVKFMVMLLRKLGYELLVAANGREVLQLLEREAARGRQHEVQCILMDASMDVMDGLECTRVIRAQQLPQRLKPFIVALTANVTEEYRRACLDSGMNLFLTKPVHVENLVSALKTAHTALQEQMQQQQLTSPAGADTNGANSVEAAAPSAPTVQESGAAEASPS